MNDRDKELYDKAYSYFEYHAGQRMSMINFFISIFGAGLALFGGLIDKVPVSCVFISGFLLIVSVLFYLIDIRNKFDVKQSQEVLCLFEKDYCNGVQKGVFSSEDSKFLLYDREFRKRDEYKRLLKNKKSKDLEEEIKIFIAKNPYFTEEEVKKSLFSRPIPHLSSCIKFLYFLCMILSVTGIALSVLLILI